MGEKNLTLLDVNQVAARIGRKPRFVYAQIESGHLPHIRLDAQRTTDRRARDGHVKAFRRPGRVLVLEADLEAWVLSRRQPARAEIERPKAVNLSTLRSAEVSIDEALPLPKVRRFA